MTLVHRILGSVIVGAFVVIIVWALALLVRRAPDTPPGMRLVQHWTENLLLLQATTGILLLLLGRRVVGPSDAWLHYLYGSVFPLIALVGGRLAALRRARHPYLGLAWGSFFAFGLTLRAVQTACGVAVGELIPCLLR